jgi:Domain of unknown function (DUF5916)/Carbohydrate family 9 binding domain-like
MAVASVMGIPIHDAYAADDVPDPSNGPTSSSIAGQNVPPAQPRATAILVDEAPTIDGVLDDPIWAKSEVITKLTQVVPVQGAPPTFPTEIRILTDGEMLYLSMRAYDPEPEKITAHRMARSEILFYDDTFSVSLDTFHDRKTGYFFQVNPNGGRRDLTFDSDSFEENWDGIWYADARIDDEGYTVEIAIPFKTVGFIEGQDVWGLNMSRRVRRFNAEARWADPSVERTGIDMENAGTLHGMSVARQGLGLDVVPSISASGLHSEIRRENPEPNQDSIEERDRLRIEPSFDAFYRVLPSLMAAVTVNTDFSQTEIDDSRVNLTRFSILFPEKREFFLRDASLFSFGGLEQENGLPFFSRRIGLDQNADPVRLNAGGRVTGRVGPFRIGLLDIEQDRKGDVHTSNLAVARIAANVLDNSTAGIILTHGDPTSNEENLLGGADFNFRTLNLIPNRTVASNVWYQHTFSESESSDYGQSAGAWGASIEYPNDIFRWEFKVKSITDGFDPALGFVNRTGIRRYDGLYRYRIRSAKGRIRTTDFTISGNVVTGHGMHSNRVENALITVSPLKITTQVDDVFELQYVHFYDNPEDPFFIVDHVGVPAGAYSSGTGILKIETSQARKISFRYTQGIGTFYDGWGFRFNPFLEWRPSKHWRLSVELDERHFFDFDACLGSTRNTGLCQPNVGEPIQRNTDFKTRLVRMRVLIAFTPNVSWSTVVQYDNFSDEIAAQSRFEWIIEPGRELFLVLGQDFDAKQGDVRATRTAPAAKLRWTFRF